MKQEKTTRVAVFMDGGLIQEIYTDQKAEIVKIDLDINDAEEDELTLYHDKEGNEVRAYVSIEKTEDYPHSIADVDKSFVDKLFNELSIWNPRNPWVNHPKFVIKDWMDEVKNNYTRLGYVDWVNHKLEDRRTL